MWASLDRDVRQSYNKIYQHFVIRYSYDLDCLANILDVDK
jgi:hypothetical protein